MRRWRHVIGGGAALVLLFSALIVTGADARIVSLTNRTSSELTMLDGANGRTTLWPEVLDAIAERPVVGVGLGADRQRMVELNAESGFTWNPQHAHNLALHVALATGWPGVVFVFAGLGVALVDALRHREPWMAALVCFVLVVGVSEPVLRAPQLIWALLAVSIALVPEAHSPAVAPGGPPGGGLFSITGAVLLALAIGLVWLEPAGWPHRVRCRDDRVLDPSGLVVSVDGSTGAARTPRGTTTIDVRPTGLTFGDNEPHAELPDTTARSVRCAAIRGDGVTVQLDVATTDLSTEGPGRILSIASGTEWDDIDLLIGQELDGLALRVRSGPDRRNDTLIPGVFTDLDEHRLTVSVGPETVRVWRDDELIATWTEELRPVSFDDWRIGRAVSIGNEVTDDRPFAGTVGSLRIYEGVRSPDELVG